jgi:adenylate cyclase
MSIRTKFLTVAAVMLLIFALTNGLGALLDEKSLYHFDRVIHYHQPLTRLVADLDVATFEYELAIERLRRKGVISPAEMETAKPQITALAAGIRRYLEQSQTILTTAIADAHNEVDERIAMAHISAVLSFLARQIDPFLDQGEKVFSALAAGNSDQAHALARGFVQFEDTFGPDLAAVRTELLGLTDRAAQMIVVNQHADFVYNLALFVVASVLGLGVSVVITSSVVSRLRQLLDGTRALENGQTVTVLPVTTRDEIGQLARAFNHMIEELHERERIKDTFGKFIDPRIVLRLVGPEAETAQAERRIVTLFFSDIQGFSSISERLTAGAMVHLLNGYFSVVADAIRTHGGVIDKYMGDGVMAFWCPPFTPGDEHAAAACRAALAQQTAITALQLELPNLTGLRRDTPELVVRMGIATGEVVIGTIGSPTAKSYTVIGDVVNLASRLEGVNKLYGTRVILSEETQRLAGPHLEVRELDVVAVVGRMESVRIYELMGLAGEIEPLQVQLRETFEAGLSAYRTQCWSAAEVHFRECLEIVPGDGPATLFLARIAQLRANPRPMDWDGVWHLETK